MNSVVGKTVIVGLVITGGVVIALSLFAMANVVILKPAYTAVQM